MNSLKNTVVIALLLGVSYGVFQLMNTPPSNIAKEEQPVEPEIQDGSLDQPTADSPESTPRAPDLMDKPFPDLPALPNQSNPAFPDRMSQGTGLADNNHPLRSNNEGSQFSDPAPNAPSNSKQFETGPLNNAQPLANRSTNQFESDSNMLSIQPNRAPKGLPPNTSVSGGNVFTEGNIFPGSLTQPANPQSAPAASTLNDAFSRATNMVIQQKNNLDALKMLSQYYHADLTQAQRSELLMWLDSLAGKVVYSMDHQLTGMPYVVREQDTFETIAARWKVPPRLVYKINEATITANGGLRSGIQLKQVNGPFEAEVNLTQRKMTIFLGSLYAGQYDLDFGEDMPIEAGNYQVRTVSQQGSRYRDARGQEFAVGSAANPYGQYWMDLGGGLCIHSRASNDRRGCIRVGQADAADVFGILDRDSRITIRR